MAPHDWRRIGRHRFILGFVCGLAVIAGAQLLVNQTRLADWLVEPLIQPDTFGPADAIVVLGAGIIGPCVPNVNSLRRTLLGARLWREARAPIVVFAGGTPPGLSCSVASVMARTAVEAGIPEGDILLEVNSRSTWQNAQNSVSLLRKAGVRRVLIVTDRLHMPRASGVFAHFGFEIERASVPVYEDHPNNSSMLWAGLREYVALAYYRSRGWLP